MDKLLTVYKCMCDETRLRILHLLIRTPLCVCHLQHILGASQVNTSRHLAVLKKAGMVKGIRMQNWTLHALPDPRPPELDRNLACLQDLAPTEPVFQRDLHALDVLLRAPDVREVLAEGGCRLPASTATPTATPIEPPPPRPLS